MVDILAVIGILGGLLCACADLFLDLKGKDNVKMGKLKVIDSKWLDMPHWRFVVSGIISMFAVPMYSCGFIALMLKLAQTQRNMALMGSIVFLWGAMGGFMIHTFLCLMPTIYQKIMKKQSFELAQDVISSVFRQIYVPFFTLYSMLVILPSAFVMVLVVLGTLNVPMWCVVLNPVVFQVVGLLFRMTKLDAFIDAPSCCAASLGLGAFGILALLA